MNERISLEKTFMNKFLQASPADKQLIVEIMAQRLMTEDLLKIIQKMEDFEN